MSIAFEELEGSPRIHIDQQRTRATRVFRVDWDQWQGFARQLVGSYRVIGCQTFFVPPLEFPEMPNLVVSDIKVEPLDGEHPEGSAVSTITSGTNRYPDAGAKVTVTYETLFDANNRPRSDLPQVPGGTFLTFRAELGAEEVATAGRVWQWDDDNEQLAPDRHPRIIIPMSTFRLTWHRVVLPPWEAIRAIRGHVNGGVFMGAAAQTVLFAGAKVSREFQFIEDGGFWRVEFTFHERTVPLGGGVGGWNHEYKDATGAWTKIVDSGGNTPYRTADFSPLFQFGTC